MFCGKKVQVEFDLVSLNFPHPKIDNQYLVRDKKTQFIMVAKAYIGYKDIILKQCLLNQCTLLYIKEPNF